MQPFDPVALVAMLQAFYPIVSVAALRTARAARPEYFGGGTLGGSKGEKLTLPDGRVFDLIFAAGGPASAQRWQALEVTGEAGGAPDPWPLEDGPLAPLDEGFAFPPRAAGVFEALVADELGALQGGDDRLHQAAQAAIDFDGARPLRDAGARLLEPAIEAHAHTRQTIDTDDMGDELGAANDTDGAINAATNEYDENAPEDVPADDPGNPPRDDDGDDDGPPPK